MLPQVSRNVFSSRCFPRLLVSSCILLLTLAGAAQEKSKPKPSAPVKQGQRHSAPSGNTGALKDPVEQHYRAAETFQLASDLKAAETEYRRVISLALQRLAAVRVLAHDDQHALALLQSATAADPSDMDVQMSLASLYFRTGDLANAKSVLNAVLAKDGNRLSAKNLLGKILFMEGDYNAAAEQFQAATHRSRVPGPRSV